MYINTQEQDIMDLQECQKKYNCKYYNKHHYDYHNDDNNELSFFKFSDGSILYIESHMTRTKFEILIKNHLRQFKLKRLLND